MSEASVWKSLRDKVFKHPDRADRVENSLMAGMFDVNYCIEGTEGWIEIKSPKEPKRETTKLLRSQHKLSQEQKNFAKKQIDAGGKAWVLIVTDKRWILIDGCWLERYDINDMTITELENISKMRFSKPVRDKASWSIMRKYLEGHFYVQV